MLQMFQSQLVDFMVGDLLTPEQKLATYAALYANEKKLRDLIDEEGCAPVFAALVYLPLPQGTYTVEAIRRPA